MDTYILIEFFFRFVCSSKWVYIQQLNLLVLVIIVNTWWRSLHIVLNISANPRGAAWCIKLQPLQWDIADWINQTLCFTGSSHDKVIVCYVSRWSVYRPGAGSFDIHDIEPSLCTHIIYCFVGMDENTFKIKNIGNNSILFFWFFFVLFYHHTIWYYNI